MTQREGLVMQVNDDHSIYMTYDGDFVKGVPVVEADVGEHGAFTPYTEKFKPMKAFVQGPFIAIAASMLFIFGAMFTSLPEAYAYVKLENGELIEIGIDEDGKVVMLEGEGINPEWESKPLDIVLVKIAEEHDVNAFSFQNTKQGHLREQLTTAIEKAEFVVEEKKQATNGTATETDETSTTDTEPVSSEPSEEDASSDDDQSSTESPGNSANAPGQKGTTPGQAGTAPGQSGKTPANGAAPPGKSGEAPGKSGAAPGKSESKPGNSTKAPGQNNDNLGKSSDKPGNSKNAPGQNKDNSDDSSDKPGNSENAPGQNKDNTGYNK